MIPYQYLQNSIWQLDELRYSLTDEQKKDGAKLFEEKGIDWINNWQTENIKEIEKYILSTPKQRERRKKWNSNFEYKFLITFFAANFIRRAILVLKAIENNPIYQNEAIEI